MRLAAGAMDYPEQVEIFGWEYEARQGMTRVDQSMKWISLSGISGENAWGVQMRCGFGNRRTGSTSVILSLKEQVVVVHLSPKQRRLGSGICGYGDNIQVISEADAFSCALTVSNEITCIIFGIDAQCHRTRLFQSEKDRDRLWLDSPPKGPRKNEWESSETFGHRYPRHSRHFSGFSILL